MATFFQWKEFLDAMQQPKAILFDLDGVLTDTSEYHYRAWKHLADDEGIPFTKEENDAHLRGVGRRDSLMYIIRGKHYSEEQIQEMMDRKNRYYLDLIKNMSPKDLVAGGKELLQEIHKAGIKIAIASSSKNSHQVVESLGIMGELDGLADGYSVVNSKPAPDLFIYAAGLVQVPVADCMGVEDADAGIEAIKTAGMQALGIGPKDRFHRADKVLPDLANKHLQDILIQ